jgi:hypothetical protein
MRSLTSVADQVERDPAVQELLDELIDAYYARGPVYTEFRIGSERMRLGFIGVYEDEYVKVSGRWKFKARKLTSIKIHG